MAAAKKVEGVFAAVALSHQGRQTFLPGERIDLVMAEETVAALLASGEAVTDPAEVDAPPELDPVVEPEAPEAPAA